MDKKVSIITVNYNGAPDTCEMIESLKRHESYPYELIVVDNGSANLEGYTLLKDKYPDVIVIRSDQNLGFAGGNNIGIQYATGDYLFFLNNDTIITCPILEILVNRLDSDRKIGCISPKTTFWPQRSKLQYAGATPMSYITLRNEFTGYMQEDDGRFDTPQETAFANGAAMMIRTADIQKFGLMAEFYFLYYEELDWCAYMQKAGFCIWYEPGAVVGHKESASVGLQSPLQVYYHTRNRLIFAQRTLSAPFERRCSYLYQTFVALPKRFLTYLCKGKLNLIAPLVKGGKDGIAFIMNK
ncbi:glycosyltransferase family 2 protein [Parabacteroides faecis]|uniref:glycosyltransferase family 2 protein n=1 Tax=Parabacteroides TaxID=375288 RepID=UPI000EFEEC2A|nr:MULTISPECIES: glycosyltransferase family 2 protein [Parabacteroides]MBC8618082.1 glycosyltransferase family 2 protein [Parabacteroides faecis]RHR99173.1 glycosyltransferase family 2 protein [Parabacteroides sp. AF14-59]